MTDERRGDCTEKDAFRIQRIEVEFAIPVWLTQDQQVVVHELVKEIVEQPYNQLKGAAHWHSFTGGKLNLSRVDAALLGKTVGPNPPADGEEPDSDDSVLVLSTSVREFDSAEEEERSLARSAKRRGRHVDDFIDYPLPLRKFPTDAEREGVRYAKFVLLLMRSSASLFCDIEKFVPKLFCTHAGKRYRVTMASRLGSIGLTSDFGRDAWLRREGATGRVHRMGS